MPLISMILSTGTALKMFGTFITPTRKSIAYVIQKTESVYIARIISMLIVFPTPPAIMYAVTVQDSYN